MTGSATSIARPAAAAGDRPSWVGSTFLASRWFDGAFLILSPLLALGLAELLPLFRYPFERTRVLWDVDTRVGLFIAIWTSSHLVAVLFRSHANPDIFRQRRFRFTAVPLALFLAMGLSSWLLVTGLVAAIFWDVYHTSMQNFGLCRIYDARLGNDPRKGRLLDVWLNHFAYIGPLLCGLSLMPTLDTFRQYTSVGWNRPMELVGSLDPYRPELRWLVLGSAGIFLAFYLYSYRRLARDGYRVSVQKIALLASTAVASGVALGLPAVR